MPSHAAQRPGHTAVLQLRPRTGALSVGVSWPEATSRAVPVVLLLAPDRFASTSRAQCATELSNRAGAVVVDLQCGSSRPGSAGRVDDAESDAAGYAFKWLADHAAELGGDPAAVVVVSVAGAVDTAMAVIARAQVDGWPLVAGHVRLRQLCRPDVIRRLPRRGLESRIVPALLATLAQSLAATRRPTCEEASDAQLSPPTQQEGLMAQFAVVVFAPAPADPQALTPERQGGVEVRPLFIPVAE